jgi:hypothetical protein
MKTKEELIREMEELIHFSEEMKEWDEGAWTRPLYEGKWSAAEVIAHIMLWDKYFLDHAVRKIARSEPITLGHPEFQAFNRDAAEYGKRAEKSKLLEDTVAVRSEIVACLRLIPEENYDTNYTDAEGKMFNVREYILDFSSHDAHHEDQLRDRYSR